MPDPDPFVGNRTPLVGQSQITITSITCRDQQEAVTDEIYFKLSDLGGARGAAPELGGKQPDYTSNIMYGLDSNTSAPYHKVQPSEIYTFTDAVRVELWEYDAGNNEDELLERAIVHSNGDVDTLYEREGARYDIEYDFVLFA